LGGWATAPSEVTINEFSISRYDGSSFVSIQDLNTNVGVTSNFPSNSGTANHTFSLTDLV